MSEIFIFVFYFIFGWSVEGSLGVVRGPVRRSVHGPGPWWGSVDRGSVFSGYPYQCWVRKIEEASGKRG